MTQFVIILYEAAIIYDRWCGTARRGAAQRVPRERELYRASRRNYLISDAADKSPKSRDEARARERAHASVVYCAIVETRECGILISSRRQFLGRRLEFARVVHEEEVKNARLREAHVLQAWHH